MAEKKFIQTFEGYCRASNIATLSSNSGVYGVYRCTYDNEEETVSVKKLLYIGKADDLNDRITNHEDWDDWEAQLEDEEEVCFCYTFVDESWNERVEAALINSNQPPLNVKYKNSFPFDKTIVICSGNHKFIKEKNTVDRH